MPIAPLGCHVLLRLCAAAMGLAAPLATAGGSEAALKAAFVYNFALYTEWPALGASFEICVAGHDTLDSALDALSAKAIAGRPIHVRRIEETVVPEDCNLLFVGASGTGQFAGQLVSLASRPLLTVADIGAEATGRPMLRLVLEQGRLGFDANQSAAQAAGLHFSAKLLRLARRVD